MWSRKCSCLVGASTTALITFIVFLFLAVTLIINPAQKNIDSVVSCFPVDEVVEIPPPSRDHLSSLMRGITELNFARQTVWRNDRNEEIVVYCAEIGADRLKSHQVVDRFVPFNNSNQTLDSAEFLPLTAAEPTSFFGLEQSALSIYLCLTGKEKMSDVPPVQFLLYKRVDKVSWDFEKNILIASENVMFDSNLCANTTILSPEDAIVYTALSTSAFVHFKTVIFYVKQIYYDAKPLNIINDSNIVKASKPKLIPGVSGQKLICYVFGRMGEECELYRFLSSHVPLVWKEWSYPLFIALCVLSFLYFCTYIIMLCVACMWYRSRHFVTRSTNYRRV